jgi:hypothetical protein
MGIKNLTEAEEKEFYRLVEKMNGEETDKDVKVKKPEIGTRYFYLDSVGDIVNAVWDDTEYDNARWDLGNVFLTEKEIVFAIEKRKVEVELERYAKEHNGPTRSDSFYLSYNDGRDEKLDYEVWSVRRPLGAVPFTSKQVLDNAIEEIGRDRILKYIFGVESEGEE